MSWLGLHTVLLEIDFVSKLEREEREAMRRDIHILTHICTPYRSEAGRCGSSVCSDVVVCGEMFVEIEG
jgi:hypothetical protein